MKEVLGYIAHKHLELVLLAVVAGLLYVTHAPMSFWGYALVPLGFSLAVYDMAVARELASRALAASKRFRLEIFLFIILAVLAVFWDSSIELAGAGLIAYVVFVIILNSRHVQWGIAQGWGDVKRDMLSFALLAIFLALLIIWEFKTESIFFLITFATFLLYRWESRVIAALALASLALCPLLLIIGEDALAEQMAVYAYYFLVMTVVLQIIEFKRGERSEPREEGATLQHDAKPVLDLRQKQS